jgi:hypothetical protein
MTQFTENLFSCVYFQKINEVGDKDLFTLSTLNISKYVACTEWLIIIQIATK